MGDTTHSTIFPILSPIKYIFPHQKPPRKGYAFRGGSPSSIIFRVDFKVALGVIAGGADFGGLGAHHDAVSYTHLTLPTIRLV